MKDKALLMALAILLITNHSIPAQVLGEFRYENGTVSYGIDLGEFDHLHDWFGNNVTSYPYFHMRRGVPIVDISGSNNSAIYDELTPNIIGSPKDLLFVWSSNDHNVGLGIKTTILADQINPFARKVTLGGGFYGTKPVLYRKLVFSPDNLVNFITPSVITSEDRILWTYRYHTKHQTRYSLPVDQPPVNFKISTRGISDIGKLIVLIHGWNDKVGILSHI